MSLVHVRKTKKGCVELYPGSGVYINESSFQRIKSYRYKYIFIDLKTSKEQCVYVLYLFISQEIPTMAAQVREELIDMLVGIYFPISNRHQTTIINYFSI